MRAFVGYSSFVLLTALLCALPFGGSKHSTYLMRSGKITYVKNAPAQTVVTLMTFFALEYYGLPVIGLITQKYFELVVSALYVSVALSVYLYVASHFVPVSEINPNADTDSTVYDFFMGRETFPKICGRLYVKTLLFRVYFIGNVSVHVEAIVTTITIVTKRFDAENYIYWKWDTCSLTTVDDVSPKHVPVPNKSAKRMSSVILSVARA